MGEALALCGIGLNRPMLRCADNPVPEANSSLFTFRWRAGAYARGKAHNNMMPPLLDFWFDFASTYSYPAAMQIAPLAQQAGALCCVFARFCSAPCSGPRVALPLNLYPAKGRYMWRDLERICVDLSLPFRQPEPFPQDSLLAARAALIGLSGGTWGARSFVPGRVRGRSSDR